MTFLRIASGVALAATFLLLIGSIGDWAAFGALSKSGMEGDGVITFILAILAAAAAGATMGPRPLARVTRWFVLPFALLALTVAIIDVIDVSSTASDFLGQEVGLSVGWGLWLTLVASVLLLVAAIMMMVAPLPPVRVAAHAYPGHAVPPPGYGHPHPGQAAQGHAYGAAPGPPTSPGVAPPPPPA